MLLFDDILHTYNQGGHSVTQGIKQTFFQYYDTQYIRFTITYRLGNDKASASTKAATARKKGGCKTVSSLRFTT